jgi:hypothetical protein
MIRAIVLVVLLYSTASVQAQTAAAGCTRSSLQATVDKYLDALTAGVLFVTKENQMPQIYQRGRRPQLKWFTIQGPN